MSSTLPVTNGRRRVTGTLATIALALLMTQMVGRAATVPSQLHYSRGFLVTGNYVVGGVDLTNANPIVNGFSTGTIQMGNSVPPNADILAAYMYWETITLTANPLQGAGVKFRGVNLDITNVLTVKETSQALIGSTASCWSSGVPLTMHHYRADVLRLLPMKLDSTNQPTGKRIVNDADLVAHSLPPHTVTLPVTGGNSIPESAGASLVVIYREDPDPGATPTESLRKIVIYDGMHIQTSIDEATTLNIQGFYKAASPASAKITHIIASGQPNNRERILFNGHVLETDPLQIGGASQRAWAQNATSTNKATYDVSAYMNEATNSAQYGGTVTTSIDHQPATGGYDCITSAAVIFSTTVQDNDHDGLPDGLEDATAAMTDPDGTVLPKLKAMGGGSDQPDVYVEANAMRADAGTSYGSATAPYDLAKNITTKTDPNGHHHLPTPADIKLIGDRLGLHNIRLHVDVGPLTESSGLCSANGSGGLPICYHSRPDVGHTDWVDNYSSTDADAYLVGSGLPSTNVAALARGGETITERACDAAEPTCQFPNFPGTVGWKVDFKFQRDWPVDNEGEEFSIDPMASDYFNWNTGSHRLRFDAGRRGVFHYVLYAHARGKPKSMPCLLNGLPGPYDTNNATACNTVNPDFNSLEYHVPSSSSGIADLPGYNVMVALGLWDEFVGRPFVRASTTFHELGHNWELWHGGTSAIWGDNAISKATYIEPHCKPYYLSSMNYLFQVHGLFDASDVLNVDFSGTAYPGSVETGTLRDSVEGLLSPTPLYQPAWFAPYPSQLALALGVSPSTRYCSGQKFGTPAPAAMARVQTSSVAANIDWKGDGYAPPNGLDNSLTNQDVNFDGTVTGGSRVLGGFDDWSSIRLDQVGANVTGIVRGSIEGTVEWGGGSQEWGGGTVEWGGGSQEWGGGSQEWGGGSQEWGGGTVEWGGGSQEWGGGSQEWGGGSQEWGGGSQEWGGGRGEREMSLTLAKELGKSRPSSLSVCRIGVDSNCMTQAQPLTALYHRIEVRFQAAPFGEFTSYEVQRKRASAADTAFTTAGTTSTNLFVDQTELADGTFNSGLQYVYRVRGLATDGNTGWSRTSAAVTPVNDAPQAANDPPSGTFEVSNKGSRQFNVGTELLSNDIDGDSPTAFRARRILSFTQGARGTVTLNSAGTTLTYTPTSRSYTGPDSFTYTADDGLSSDTPLVPLSAPSGSSATVSITITR